MIRDLCQQYVTSFAEEFKMKMRETEDELIAVKNEVSELRKKMSSPVKGTETAQTRNQEAAKIGIKEIADREARGKNLLLFNVPESKFDDPPASEEEDEALVKTMCKDLLHLDVPFSQTIRLGQRWLITAGH